MPRFRLPPSLAVLTCLALGAACDAPADDDLAFRGDPTAPDPGGPTGTPDPGGPTTEPTDFVVCEHRISGSDLDVGRGLPYCATAGLDSRRDFSNIKRIVVAQHGRGGDAPRYFDKLTAAAQTAATEGYATGDTFVIAPQFIAQKDVDNENIPAWMLAGVIWWKNDSEWPLASESSDGGGNEYSSFHLYERLLDAHLDRMPNVDEIIFVGQSAGGQAIHRFALLNDYPFDPGDDVRYYPANGFTYTYLTSDRPTYQGAPQTYSFSPGFTDADWAWPDTEICWQFAGGEKLSTDFDDFWYGVNGLPDYAFDVGDDEGEKTQALIEAYLDRNVTYLVGEVDVVNDSNNNSDCSANVQAQGRHRRERAHAYQQHVLDQGGNHGIVRVPDVGHGDALFGKKCVIETIFGAGSGCDPIDDAELFGNWVGETVDIAFADIDGDPGREMAVVSKVGDDAEVFLIDDADNNYAVLQHVNGGWVDQQQPTSVAFGDVMGDGKNELVVGRKTIGLAGGGGFVVFEDNGAFSEVYEYAPARDAVAVTVGNVFGNAHADIGVAYDEVWALRWEVLGWDGVDFLVTTGGAFLDASRPIDIKFANVASDDAESEIIVGSDADTGPRIYIYDPGNFTKQLGAGWKDGDQLTAFDVGPWDGDGASEIAVARTSQTSWTWAVFDDASTGYKIDRFSAPFQQPTAIAMGSMGTWYGALAVAYADAPNEQVTLRTYFTQEDPVLGHMRRDANLGVGGVVRKLTFGDVDGHGNAELVIGRGGAFGAGWRVKVIAAP